MGRKDNGECKDKLKILFKFLLTLGLTLTSMILSIKAREKTADKIDSFKSLLADIDSFPYYEFRPSLQIITRSQQEGAFSGFEVPWQGSLEGCQCANTMKSESCSSDDLGAGCKDIPSYDGEELAAIAYDNNANKIFIQSNSLNGIQMSESLAQQNGDCKMTQPYCGNKSIPDTVICLSSDSMFKNCPLYDIQFSKTQRPDLVAAQYTETQINSNLYLYKDYNGATSQTLPISRIVSTAGPGPCLDNPTKQTRSFSTTETGDYILMNEQRDSCETDPDYKEVGFSITEDELFSMNLPSQTYQSMLTWPGFNLKQSTQTYKIYVKKYYDWKKSARQELLLLATNLRKLDDLEDKVILNEIFAICSFAIMGCFINIMYLISQCLEHDVFFCTMLKGCVQLIFNALSMAFGIICVINASKQHSDYKQVIDSDPTTNEHLSDQLNDLYDFVQTDVFIPIIISIVMGFVNAIKDVIGSLNDLLNPSSKRRKVR